MTAPSPPPLAIRRSGLVTSVGLGAPESCAAIRARITNPIATRFLDTLGEPIMAHEVPLPQPWRGLGRLTQLASMAIRDCLADEPAQEWPRLPLLLCVAETSRPGRLDGLDDRLLVDLQQALGERFSPQSAVLAQGRVGMVAALAAARGLIDGGNCPQVLIAAADSRLAWPELRVHERGNRLLTGRNVDGFMPGQAGAAVLVSGGGDEPLELRCTGTGFGLEHATIASDEPLRADGLVAAIRQALAQAGREMHDLDFRIADLSGEQYDFKEAALALLRTLRGRREVFDLWHPAESVGETGAAAGLVMLAVAHAACLKRYAPGPRMLMHTADDDGRRAAAVFEFAGDAR